MKNKRIIVVSLCTFMFLAGILYYANLVTASAKEVFEQDGFVLSSALNHDGDKAKAEQFYFKANSTYQKKWPSKILFHDTESSKVVLENESYLHYTNGDMGAFADGVLVDLNSLEQAPINYYRIKAGSILKKVGDGYQMNYLGKKVTMTSFLWKLSENKYLVVSPDLKVNFGDNNAKDVKSFLEIEIKDKGIVTLRNQNVSFQTVVEGSTIAIPNGTTLNFNNKEITKGDKSLFSLTQMVVDSNSNIEIVPDENKSKPGTTKPGKDPSKPSSEDPNVNPNENPIPNATNPNTPNDGSNKDEAPVPPIDFSDGAIVPNIPNDKPQSEEGAGDGPVEQKKTPTVTLNSLKASVAGVKFEATVSDEEDILTSAGINVKIYEKSSNKLVYSTNVGKGNQKIEEDIQSLNTNTDYVLVISGTYVINNIEYTNDFLNKQFRTDMLDLEYKIYEKTDTTLSYKVYADKGTKITGATLTLFESNKEVKLSKKLTKEEILKSTDGGFEIDFDSLSSNKVYYTKMTDVIYEGSMTISEYDAFKEVKTLKKTPTLEKPTSSIDKRSATVSLFPGEINDPDIGIQKYRYEIIDALDTSNVVYTTERDTKSSVEVSIDGKIIQRKHNYFWRMVVIFNDNDKQIEVTSPESDLFSLDANNLPLISYNIVTVQHDSVNGTIDINDTDKVILRGDFTDSNGQKRRSSIKIFATDPVSQGIDIGAAASTDISSEWDGKATIPTSIPGGLRANETITFKIYADVNLGENQSGTDEDVAFNRNQYYLGEVRVKTANTVPIRVTAEKDPSTEPEILRQTFILNTRLASLDPDDEAKASYLASTLQRINFTLYRGVVPATDEDITNAAASRLITTSVRAEGTTAQEHASSLKEQLFDQEGTIRSENITYDWSTYTDEDATIVFDSATDYVGNVINLGETANRVFTFKVNGNVPPNPPEINNSIDFQLIRNSELAVGTDWEVLGTEPIPGLNRDTIVGISFVPQINNSAGTINTIRYSVSDTLTPNQIIATSITTMTPANRTIPRVVLPIANGIDGPQPVTDTTMRRGHRYRISYEVGLDLDFDGLEETTMVPNPDVPTAQFTSRLINVRRQAATIKTKLNYIPTRNVAQVSYLLTDPDASYMGTGGAIPGAFVRNHTNGAWMQRTVSLERSTNATDWKTFEVDNTRPGNMQLIISSVLVYNIAGLANGDGEQVVASYRTYGDSTNLVSNFQATTEIRNNALQVMLTPAAGRTDEQFRNALMHITSAQITVQERGVNTNQVVINNAVIPNIAGDSRLVNIRIPLSQIATLRNKQLSVSMRLRHTTGETTTNLESITNATDSYAVELVDVNSGMPRYLISNAEGALEQQNDNVTRAKGSYFAVTPIGTTGFTLTDRVTNRAQRYNVEYTQFPLRIVAGGVTSNIAFNKLAETNMPVNSNGVQSGFQAIAASITVGGGNGGLDITRELDKAVLRYNLDMGSATTAKGNLLYFELYRLRQGSETEFEGTPIKTYQKSTNDAGNQTVTFTDLKLGQTYRVKEYVKIDVPNGTGGGTREIKQYLFDRNEGTIGFAPQFTAASRVEVTNMRYSFVNTKVGNTVNRKMKLDYRIDQLGFTKVNYELFEWNPTTNAYDNKILTQNNTTANSFRPSMSMEVSLGTAANQLKVGKRYQVRVRIYSTKNPYGVTTETMLNNAAESTINFQLPPLRNPLANIQLVPGKSGTNDTITARINISDPDFAGVDSRYKVKLRDAKGKDITPTTIASQNYNYSNKNQQIVFTNDGTATPINSNSEYSVEIITKVDIMANGTQQDYTSKASVITQNSFGVALGDIEIAKNPANGKADLQFYDSVNLSKVKKISYTLYNVSDASSVSVVEERFAITSSGTGTNQYWVHTISGFRASGKYLVQMQFLGANNELIDSANKTFIYN